MAHKDQGELLGECEECGEEINSMGDTIALSCSGDDGKEHGIFCDECCTWLFVALGVGDDGIEEKPKTNLLSIFKSKKINVEDTYYCPFCFYVVFSSLLEDLKKQGNVELLDACFIEMLQDGVFFKDDFIECLIVTEEEDEEPIIDMKQEKYQKMLSKYRKNMVGFF